MGLILCLILGGLVGCVAGKSDVRHKWADNMLLGFFGAIGGGWVMATSGQTAASPYNFMATLLGAATLIFLAKIITVDF